jgi:hypothetical protein
MILVIRNLILVIEKLTMIAMFLKHSLLNKSAIVTEWITFIKKS